MASAGAHLVAHVHGKSRVRLARVWRNASGRHTLVEWSVDVLLESAMERAYTDGDNSGMTATDTVRNSVYYVAKGLAEYCSADAFAVRLAEHFVATYPLVSAADVSVEQKGWERASVGGLPHDHGYVLRAPAARLAFALARRGCATAAGGGLRDLTLLKTTQSGYEGFLRDALTALPETRERMLATAVSGSWSYNSAAAEADSDELYDRVCAALCTAFFGARRPCLRRRLRA
jgi:urate oxidase